MIIVRAWARARFSSASDQPSLYAHALMVLTFLQAHRHVPTIAHCEGPKLVCKGTSYGKRKKDLWQQKGAEVNCLHCRYFVAPERFRKRPPALNDLLYFYFKWLSRQVPANSVLSPRLGRFVTDSRSYWRSRAGQEKASWRRLSIEDPFAHADSVRPLDLGDVWTKASQERFFAEVDPARKICFDGRNHRKALVHLKGERDPCEIGKKQAWHYGLTLLKPPDEVEEARPLAPSPEESEGSEAALADLEEESGDESEEADEETDDDEDEEEDAPPFVPPPPPLLTPSDASQV